MHVTYKPYEKRNFQSMKIIKIVGKKRHRDGEEASRSNER